MLKNFATRFKTPDKASNPKIPRDNHHHISSECSVKRGNRLEEEDVVFFRC